MRFILKAALFAVVIAALAAGLAGTSRGGKETAEFQPGGSWLSDMRARVTEQIDDDATATAILAELDKIEAELIDLDVAVKAYYVQLNELDRNYETRRADYEAAIMKFNTERMAVRDRIINIRFRMRDHTTPAQWKIIADIDKSLLEEFQRGYSL